MVDDHIPPPPQARPTSISGPPGPPPHMAQKQRQQKKANKATTQQQQQQQQQQGARAVHTPPATATVPTPLPVPTPPPVPRHTSLRTRFPRLHRLCLPDEPAVGRRLGTLSLMFGGLHRNQLRWPGMLADARGPRANPRTRAKERRMQMVGVPERARIGREPPGPLERKLALLRLRMILMTRSLSLNKNG